MTVKKLMLEIFFTGKLNNFYNITFSFKLKLGNSIPSGNSDEYSNHVGLSCTMYMYDGNNKVKKKQEKRHTDKHIACSSKRYSNKTICRKRSFITKKEKKTKIEPSVYKLCIGL